MCITLKGVKINKTKYKNKRKAVAAQKLSTK